MIPKINFSLAATVIFLCMTAAAQNSPVEKEIISSNGTQQSYYVYLPPQEGHAERMPLIVLMHGAGGSGADQIEAWRELAQEEHIILLAPNIGNSSSEWDQLYDHPEWIRDSIDAVSKQASVDPRRIYLWGYSAGGMFAFYFAFLESRYFAAASVHGGVIENAKYQMADFALRKIPIAYYIGTKDQWWSVHQARATRDALTVRSFPVHYLEMKGADHNFFARHAEITLDAWNYMKGFALQAAPQFDSLDLVKIKAALR